MSAELLILQGWGLISILAFCVHLLDYQVGVGAAGYCQLSALTDQIVLPG